MTLTFVKKRPGIFEATFDEMFNGRNDKIFIPRQNQIRIVNVILYKSFWRWQNPSIERIL